MKLQQWWSQWWSRPWARRAGWALGVVLALWGLGWLAVPPLFKYEVQKLATEKLGRTVTLGAVAFKPWSLELTLQDLAVAGADGRGTQLQVRRVHVDGAITSLLRWAPVIDEVTVEGPAVRLTHLGEGRFDIDDILQKFAAPENDGAPQTPLEFALYNLALRDGAVDFIDQRVGKTQTVRDLNLTVPFLSNFDAKRTIHTAPHLAFKLNGSAFDTTAQSTPFAATRKTDATLQWRGLDLEPFLGYLPASLPVRLRSGVIDANLVLAFEQTPAPVVRLSGDLTASRVRVEDAQSRPLLAFGRLDLALADVRPLARSATLSAVTLTDPALAVRRAGNGRLNVALAPPPGPSKNIKKIANKDQKTLENGKKESEKPAAAPWKLQLARVTVRGGQVDWLDDMTPAARGGGARLALRDLGLDVTGVSAPMDAPGVAPMAFSGRAMLDAARLDFGGTASVQAASVTATVSALPLSAAAPYVAQYLKPALNGTLDAALGVSWQASTATAGTDTLRLRLDRMKLDRLALTEGRETLAAVAQLALADASLDLGRRAVTLGKLELTRPSVRAGRQADGQWMVQRWLRDTARPDADALPAQGKGGSSALDASSPPWTLAMGEFLVKEGVVNWSDAATPRPVAVDLSSLHVRLRDVVSDAPKPASLELAARIGAGSATPGRLSYRGTVGMAPLAARGAIDIVRLPAHALTPYLDDTLNIDLLRADTYFKGRLAYADSPAGPRVRVSGDTVIEEFRAHSLAGQAGARPAPGGESAAASPEPAAQASAASSAAARGRGRARNLGLGDELLSWKTLNLRGVDVSMAPGTATTVDVRETALSDFYARVIVHRDGRINLQNLLKPEAGGTVAPTPAPESSGKEEKTGANNDHLALGSPENGQKNVTPAAGAAAGAGTTASARAPVIRIGPVSLVGGRVDFSDRFIRPNYSANLSELTGRLSAFSSEVTEGAPALADLELRGRAEGTASLEVTGKINPLAKPLALDIKAKVRDLELAPLTPYAVKYAGHGIERGKLSMDVAYRVQPDGQLTASNQLILNQLSFGEPVQGAPASLPVKLAVALLADRNGVIDIDLPISGSLNDPQFRLGTVIFKVIVNLIGKAITAPFALLANALGGGGSELSQVAFAPGSAELTPKAREGLDKVAKVLIDRPALIMTVVGAADLQAEREGYRRERLRALVEAEKRRSQTESGTATLTVSAQEYPALLRSVYKRADMPKPRNVIGLAKDIPVPEMEALLLANIPVSEGMMRELATRRGVAVRDYLATRQLPLERLFLGAPGAGNGKAGEKPVAQGVAGAAWSPHAELRLTAR